MIIDEYLSNIIDYDSSDKVYIDTLTTNNTGLITNIPTVIGNSAIIGYPNYSTNIVKFPHNKLSSFNMLVFGNIFEYMNEKDMPTDVFVKYCKFINRIEDMIGE